ncbi:MAG: hypothetical protein ACLTTU_09945 [Bilophila wadsworthia]
MKGIHLDPHRGYRERCAPRDGEHGFQLVIGETDLRVTAVSPLPEGFKDALAARVRTLRGELEAWIVLHPEFRHSLVPVPLSCSAPPPEIVRRMTEAGYRRVGRSRRWRGPSRRWRRNRSWTALRISS